MKSIYLAIVAHIRSKIPAIKWMDVYHGQDEDPTSEDGINYPAIYIQIGDLAWEDCGAGVQEAKDSVITLRICSDSIEGSAQLDDPLELPEPAMQHLSLVDQVTKFFQGHALTLNISGNDYPLSTDFQRGLQIQTFRRNALMIDAISFRTDLIDYSSSQWNDLIETSLVALVEIEAPA
jgi:hypothetical protein